MKQKLLYIILMILCAFAWSGEVWGQTMYYLYEENGERSWLSPNESDSYTLPDFRGSTLVFEVKRTPKVVVIEYCNEYPVWVQYSTNNKKWNDITSVSMDNKNTWYGASCTIPDDAKYIRFASKTGATGYRHVRNVKVSRPTTLTSSTSSLSFNNVKKGSSSSKTISVNYNNTYSGATLTGSCTNSAFTVKSENMGENGSKDITITYSPTAAGSQTGTITLTMGTAGKNNAVTYSFTVSGTGIVDYTYKARAYNNTYGTSSVTVSDGTTANNGAEASASVSSSTSDPVSKTATFLATPNSGYEFVGWGTSSTATTYESTSNPYTVTLKGTFASSNPSKTLYAIFKPYFNFTVDAKKIYDHGTVTKSVAAKVLGSTPDVSSASTQATFTASPSAGSTFIGWYYDEAHTQLASTDATYYPQVINESAGSTKNLTLYAYFKANQAINFTNATYDKNVIVGELVSGAAAATASSGLDVSYSTSNATIATVNENGDVEGKAASNDDVTITVSQAGNDEYYAATSITRDFHVISKYQAVYTPSFTGSSPTIYVDDKPTITVSNTSDEFDFDSSDKTVVDISKSGNVITLTAKKAGTSEITLTQPETRTHSAVSATYNITVAKVANTLGVVLSGTSAQVDAAINVTFSEQNNTVTDILGEITEQSLSSDVNNGTDPQVITYANGVITACNAGTAKITFTQAETDKYAGFTSSIYEITVTKIGNPITITLAGGSATNIKLKYGATASLAYSSVNPASTVEVNRVSGNYSTCVNGTITAGNTAGTDLYEVIQAETYKYEAGYASFIIRVNNTDEALGYVLNDSQEYSHGTGSGVVHTYELSGPGETLYYSACRGTAVTIYYNMYVEYSTDNSNWKQAQDNTSLDPGYKDFSCSIPEDARYVRFRFPAGGTLVKYVKNVYVPRKTYFRPSVDKTDLGTVYTDQTATASFSIDYSTTNGGPIIVSTNNDHFAPSETSLTRADNSDGTKTFAVTYTPNPNSIGAESATITVGDLFNSKQYTLTATSAKRANTLAVIGEQDLMVDDEVQNVYSGKNSDASLICNPSKEGVVTFDADKNRIKAVGEGTVTLTFTQAENDYYNGATKSVTVKVSKYNQMLSWENELDGAARTLNIGDELTTNTATATSGLAVSYSSSNPTALEVDATTGKLTAKTGGSNIGITVTQAGNYKYNEAPSITRYFTIISRIDATVTTSLSETGNNTFPIGSEGITIGCNALLTESALSISGDENVVSVSFANNTFTLTALAEGTVTVALTRAEDDGYNAINKTYTIEVIKPVLVLDPTKAPVINYQDYSSVTYSGTLKSGYSTIALPFNTTVETLTGRAANDNDWVAQLSVVTYNAHDGYSLYFSKSNTIEANQPYILHLGTAVNSPVFTNVSVVAAEEATQNATKGVYLTDWTMHSNYYDPAFDMNGYYGVVNGEGVLKKGTANSTLKAFHAYIEGPTSAPVKAAYLDEDEADAILELLKGEETGTENIYDLQGRQLPRPGKGINIIRNADGSVRKVMMRN